MRADGLRFQVQVQPRAKRPGVGGRHGDALRVRVAAAPVDGAANAAVIDALAEALGVPRRAVTIIGGETSRSKLVAVTGADPAAVQRLADAD